MSKRCTERMNRLDEQFTELLRAANAAVSERKGSFDQGYPRKVCTHLAFRALRNARSRRTLQSIPWLGQIALSALSMCEPNQQSPKEIQ